LNENNPAYLVNFGRAPTLHGGSWRQQANRKLNQELLVKSLKSLGRKAMRVRPPLRAPRAMRYASSVSPKQSFSGPHMKSATDNAVALW